VPSDLVLASHRGPVSFTRTSEGFRARRGSGGLVSGLLSAAQGHPACWVAAAITDDDRAAVAAGALPQGGDGLDVRLIALDPARHHLALDRVCNEVLWFAMHQLWDSPREPTFGPDWADAWAAYVELNEAFAMEVAQQANQGAAVIVQDYHLCLLPQLLRRSRPDLRVGFFLHTPWAPPETLSLLPTPHAEALLRGMLAADRVAFHTDRWAEAFDDCCREILHTQPPARAVHPLGVDGEVLAALAEDAEVASRRSLLRERLAGRRLLLRVDRMELSKNIARGVHAFGLLLERRPELAGEVVHLVLAVPSRGDVPAYRRYAQDVRAAVAQVNARHAVAGWTPVLLDEADDFPRSVAALQLAEVLVVTPLRDGMNLVAKEGSVLGTPVLVLSHGAGAAEQLRGDALMVDACDVTATATALGQALDLGAEQRLARNRRLRKRALEHPPASWLADQIAAL
jgi:trehalose 6-phosphate synthase